MRVGVLGINHKLADLKLRELLAKTCDRRFGPGRSTHGMHHLVLLSTCNRTEVYFSSEELPATHSYLLNILRHEVGEEFDQKLYSYFGHDCFLHLCRVTAGLDSAIAAETEIQGQVKCAYENAQRFHALPHHLHYLFQKSLGTAKKIRAVLPFKPGLPDIEHAIYQAGQHLFTQPQQASVLFIGASEINQRILSFFKTKRFANLHLCNRSYHKGLAIAQAHEVSFVPWEHAHLWAHYDWIILGTKSPEYIVAPRHFSEASAGKKLIVDLGVPRNADPLLAKRTDTTLLNIDQINRLLKIRRQRLADSLNQAEELILEAIQQQVALFQKKQQSKLSFQAAG